MGDRLHHLLEPWISDQRVSGEPEHVFCLDHDGQTYSYDRFQAITRTAEAVLRDAGVRAGDRVLLVAENCLTYAAFVFACSRLDAWMIPLNARASADELAAIADHATPRAIVFTPEASEPSRIHAARLGAMDAGDLGCGRALVAGTLNGEPEPCFASGADQVAALVYTSGTTGSPKGVMLTHANLIFSATTSARLRALTRDDHVLSVVPGTHIYSFASALLAPVSAGARIEFMPRFDPATVLRAFAGGVSVMPAVPQMYALILSHLEEAGIESPQAPRLRFIAAGGAPLDPDWKRRVEGIFGLTLHNGYGMTEAAPTIASTSAGRERSDISCGPLVDGMDGYLAPLPGADDLDDGVGELLVRGPNIMMGYYRNPDETARVLTPEGYLRTGDLARIADDGAVTIVGRCKELIIRSGFNVYPPEVEAALNSHPGVTQAAVVGRAENGNEDVLAFVQSPPSSGVTEAGLKVYLSERLTPYKRPGRIIVAEALPVSAANKILKHRLIETFSHVLD